MKRVLVTDDCHSLLLDGLREMGYACDYQPQITLEETRKKIRDYEGLIINSKILVDREFLDEAARLTFIGRLGSGMEIVDRAYAAQKGVAVLSSPEGNCNAVAEHAIGMLLALANRLRQGDAAVRTAQPWDREGNRGFELEGRTLGIIGFGHTGSRLARKLQGWDMRILAYDKYRHNYTAGMPWVEESDPETICREADIISLHLPLTEETLHYADKAFFDRCKPGVVLVNTARGKCVRTADLLSALESGRVGGACLDVFENEKPETYSGAEREIYQRLFALDQVVLTPHVAGWTHESKRKLAEVLLQKIAAALSQP